MNKIRSPLPDYTGLEVRAAASETLMNSRMRASAPLSCNEHIWLLSLFTFSLNLLCTCASSWRKSIAIPPVSISKQHLTNSCKCNISLPDSSTNTKQWSSAQQDRAETGKVKTGKELYASTSDRLDTYWVKQEGGCRMGTLPPLVSHYYLLIDCS